jgi:predicted methyltransferase
MRAAPLLAVAAFGLLLAAAPSLARDDALAQVIAGAHRTPELAARDRYRHPQETLEFFGLEPDMTVVEIWPSVGWWTEILAPYLRERGHYYAAQFVVDGEDVPPYRKDLYARFMAKLQGRPELYDRTVVTHVGLPDQWTIAPPGSADLVLTFRNVHNWIKGGYDAEMFAAMYRALKPGGILGIEEHRGASGMLIDEIEESGYVPEEHVIQLAQRAGFKLVERSEINANPLDTTLHPAGVWTLPPTLRLGDEDKDKYLAIGESDRMTLKFAKPRWFTP